MNTREGYAELQARDFRGAPRLETESLLDRVCYCPNRGLGDFHR